MSRIFKLAKHYGDGIRLLLVLLALPCAVAAQGWDKDLEQRLTSKDPSVSRAAVEQTISKAETVQPLLLMHAAARLFEFGQRDSAVFWFYAAQLRARYAPELQGENSQILTIFLMTLAEPINAYALRDISTLLQTLDRVMVWDEKTFVAWAREAKLNPGESALTDRRRKAREGLGPYRDKLLAEREQLEKFAREYKGPEERRREEQAAVERDYSKKPVEVVVGKTAFRIPANYLSARGAVLPATRQSSDLAAWIFLPNYEGFRTDNWRNPGGDKNSILVRIRPDIGLPPEKQIATFLAESGVATEKLAGFDAHLYDSEKTRAPLPVISASRHYVIEGKRARGGPVYLICDAPRPGIAIQSGARCEMFLRDPRRHFRISARFQQDRLSEWPVIEKRLSALVESWVTHTK